MNIEHMKENAELALETLQLEWQTLDKRRAELKAELTGVEHEVTEVMSETEEVKFKLWYLGLSSGDRTTLYVAVTNREVFSIRHVLPSRLLSRALAQGLVVQTTDAAGPYNWNDTKAQIVEDTFKALISTEKA